MRTFIAVAVLGALPLFAAPASEPSGTYQLKTVWPVTELSSDGSSRVLRQTEVIERIEFRADHELRYWRLDDGAAQQPASTRGAWQVRDGQLFYYVGFGPTGRIGMRHFRLEAGGLELSGNVGWQLALMQGVAPQHFDRVAGQDAVFPGASGTQAETLATLNQITGEITLVEFVGSGSREQLDSAFRRAFQAHDFAMLMKLSYPTTRPYMADERMSQYLLYRSLFLGTDMEVVREEPLSAFATEHETSKSRGIDFPAPIVPEGRYWVGKSGSMQAIYYGTVAGRWGLIGSPLILKNLPVPASAK
jgi:hypothetical protein